MTAINCELANCLSMAVNYTVVVTNGLIMNILRCRPLENLYGILDTLFSPSVYSFKRLDLYYMSSMVRAPSMYTKKNECKDIPILFRNIGCS